MKISRQPRSCGPGPLPRRPRPDTRSLLRDLAAAAASEQLDSPISVSDRAGEVVPNLVILSGVVVREPREELSPAGTPVTLLILEFAVPDAKDPRERWEFARNSIEVPNELFASYQGAIEKGTPLLILGRLVGGGDVLATSLEPATLRPAGAGSTGGSNQ